MAGLFVGQLLEAVLLLLLLHATAASATLTVYHGRVTSVGGLYKPVEGVAVLNIGSGTSHLFDCVVTGGSVENLRWEKAEGILRFPVSTETVEIDSVDVMVRRILFGVDPPYGDVGVYTCVNGGETASINITGGATAVCAVEPSEEVLLGGTAQLQVYAAGDPSIASQEISWTREDGAAVVTDSRVSLTNSNKRLLVRNVGLEDSGMYRVDIRRQITALIFRNLASTVIDLDVHVGVTILSSPVSALALEHASVTLTCEFRGNPEPMITWEREGSDDLPVVTRRDITVIPVRSDNASLYTVTSRFTIQNVLYEDEGRYRCTATNTLTGGVQRSDTSAFAELTVTPRLQLTAQGLNIVDENGLVSVSAGSYVEIQCSGSGDLTWESSSGATITESSAVSPPFNVYQAHDPTTNVQSLVIATFSSADIALYTCRTDLIVNGISFAESVYISSSDPVIYIPDETIYAPENGRAEIRATVYSSDLNSLVIEWYHARSLIDTASDTRYSVSTQGTSLHTLNIARVEAALLGRYEAVVTAGDRNRSDSVQLAFPDPPIASVIPTTISVAEGESASFRCEAGGTRPTVVWSLLGNLPLPSGVVQSGNDLVISRASQDHAGQYECTVTNSAGATSSTATLTVFYLPFAILTREGTTEASFNQVLQVVAEEGDSAPTFTCSADGSPTPTLSWGGKNGGVALPSGVSLVASRQNLALVWGRALEYTDSGNYMCNATNSAGASSVRLELLVRRSPAITTVFPTAPVTSSASNLVVPLGYRGTVVTCAALGWPTPTIGWVRSAGNLTESRMISDSAQNLNLAFVSARLRWLDGFLEFDAGDYTCVVQASDTDAVSSKVISLEVRTEPPPTSTPVTCSVSSLEVTFQVRVLDTDCLAWGEDLKTDIASSFMSELVNTVSAACQDCVVTSQDIEVAGIPTCSEQVERAVIFRGTISTENPRRTQDIFCALSRWQLSGPLVRINTNFHLVDRSCTIKLRSLNAMECSGLIPGVSFPLIPVVAASGGAVLIFSLLFFLVVCCCCCVCKAGSRKSDKLKITPGTCSATSPYERTHHLDGGSISLMRYTDRINPETPTSLSSPDSHENVYSTLNRAEMSLPPPPPFNPSSQEFEMEHLRKDSSALLLPRDTVDGKGAAPFQIVQGVAVEPYEVAISSRENLCNFGGGMNVDERHAASQRILSSGRYESGNPSRQLTHTLSNGAVSVPRGIGSSVGAPYEQVDRRYGLNEFQSDTSPNLQARAGTMPTRVASSGHIVMRGMPPGVVLGPPAGFRRHQSAVENSGFAAASSDSDYMHLNRGGERRAVPAPLVITHRGERMASVSSMPSSTPTGHQTHHLPRLDKRHSITNYSRGSPSPSDTLEKLPLNFTPTSESPPPYKDAALSSVSSPYTPSEPSSMLDNGAYDGINHLPATHGVVVTRESLKASAAHMEDGELEEQQPWYNASDVSIDQQPPVHGGTDAGEPGVIPYPQVGSYDIDGRRRSSGVVDGRVPRISVPTSAPFPYADTMDSNVDSLARMHRSQPNHFHTVVV